MSTPPPPPQRGPLEQLLRPFGDVRAGEGTIVILFTLQLFVLLVGYYLLKSVREPLVLASGSAELKSYAAAAQAFCLMGLVPVLTAFASRFAPLRLLAASSALLGGVLLLFLPATLRAAAGAPVESAAGDGIGLADFFRTGFLFYVWVGIFSVATIAQFWSLANDLFERGAGERLFPIIGVGATAGAVAGSALASVLFRAEWSPAALLALSLLLYATHVVGCVALVRAIHRHDSLGSQTNRDRPPVPGLREGLQTIFRSSWTRGIAALLLLLNFVNTTGEYLLSRMVKDEAARRVAAGLIESQGAFIGTFYADFFFVVNLLAIAAQAFLASRLVRWFGIRGVVLALPVVAFGVYGLAAIGVALPVFRAAKMAENASDYSLMNTARAMLWLPASRAEKYAGKQAVDTLVVRFGDVLSAGLVFAGTSLAWSLRGFAAVNVALVVVWIGVALAMCRAYERRASAGV